MRICQPANNFTSSLTRCRKARYGAINLAQLGTMIEGAVRNGYSRSLENQADRIGLEYMAQAGYDPREAPKLWKQMTKAYGLQVTNAFWSTHENQNSRQGGCFGQKDD